MKPETQVEVMATEWENARLSAENSENLYREAIQRTAERMIMQGLKACTDSGQLSDLHTLEMFFPSTELAPSEAIVRYNGHRIGWGYVEGPPPGGDWDSPHAVVMYDYSPDTPPDTAIPELASLAFALKCAETITKNYTIASPEQIKLFVR